MESLALAFQATATIRQLLLFAPVLQRLKSQVVAVLVLAYTLTALDADRGEDRWGQKPARHLEHRLVSDPKSLAHRLGSHRAVELFFQSEDQYIEASVSILL